MIGKKRKSGSHSAAHRGLVRIDRWTHLEAAAMAAEKKQRELAQHGPVKIIVKDGKPVL